MCFLVKCHGQADPEQSGVPLGIPSDLCGCEFLFYGWGCRWLIQACLDSGCIFWTPTQRTLSVEGITILLFEQQQLTAPVTDSSQAQAEGLPVSTGVVALACVAYHRHQQLRPLPAPLLLLQDVASGKAKPWTFGGIDRIGCANCQQKGLWPKFCLWRRTEVPLWDS